MHLILKDGQALYYSVRKLRQDNPNTSFPAEMSDAFLAEWDVFPYSIPESPDYDRLTQRLSAAPLVQIKGAWVQPWQVDKLPLDQAESNVRSHRDDILQETDWRVIKAAEKATSLTPEWASYRQALRDVTKQDGFPFSVKWTLQP